MTSTDRNYLVPDQEDEKLEWVTPKISLMGAGDTDGAKSAIGGEGNTLAGIVYGPS